MEYSDIKNKCFNDLFFEDPFGYFNGRHIAQVNYSDIKNKCIEGLFLDAPFGYFDDNHIVQIALVEGYVIEVSTFGLRVCPAIRTVVDEAELQWFIDNHHSFDNYKRSL